MSTPSPFAYVGRCPLCGNVLAGALNTGAPWMFKELAKWAKDGLKVETIATKNEFTLDGCSTGCAFQKKGKVKR